MPLLDLKQVSKSFAYAKGNLSVLENISFTVEEGEFLAVVGPSGCGKSTMLRVINGIMPPTAGQVLYNGRHDRRDQPRVRDRLPVVRPAAVADGQGQYRDGTRSAGYQSRGVREALRRLYRQSGTRRFRGGLSARAVRRDEAARRPGPRTRGRTQGAPDGRAVLGGRCADRDYAPRGAASTCGRRPAPV